MAKSSKTFSMFTSVHKKYFSLIILASFLYMQLPFSLLLIDVIIMMILVLPDFHSCRRMICLQLSLPTASLLLHKIDTVLRDDKMVLYNKLYCKGFLWLYVSDCMIVWNTVMAQR